MKIGQCRAKVKQYLKDTPEVCAEIEKKVREVFENNTSLIPTENGSSESESAAKPAAADDDDEYAEFSPEELD